MSKLSKAERQRLFLQNNPKHFLSKEIAEQKEVKNKKLIHKKNMKNVV